MFYSIYLKKKVSLILSFLIIISSLSLFSVNSDNFVLKSSALDDSTWCDLDIDSGKYLYADFSPFVDVSSPAYVVNTPEQLAAVAIMINHSFNDYFCDMNGTSVPPIDFEDKNIRLGNDINLSEHLWEPIGYNDIHCFNGNFDGCGFRILGMQIGSIDPNYINNPNIQYFGFIGKTTGYIWNTYIDYSSIYANNDSMDALIIGLIAGSVSGDLFIGDMEEFTISEIYNCQTGFNSLIRYTLPKGGMLFNHIGGLIGYSNHCKTEGCINRTTISGELNKCDPYEVLNYYKDMEPDKCYAYIEVNSNDKITIGGLVGSACHSEFDNCLNQANINTDITALFIGGIVGEVKEESKILNSLNEGNLDANGLIMGGIVGFVSYSNNSSVLIEGCSCFSELNIHRIPYYYDITPVACEYIVGSNKAGENLEINDCQSFLRTNN